MDIALFFDKINKKVVDGLNDHNSFYKNINSNIEQMPAYQNAEIALVGLTENRGTENNKGVSIAAFEIRKKLYQLKKGSGAYNIVDLGNLRNGHDLEETNLRLKEVCEYLIRHNTLPIIIGGSHDMDYGQYRSYEGFEKLVSILNIDAKLDIKDNTSSPPSERHIRQILTHLPNYLFNYNQLAYQTYLIDNEAISALERLYFETYRVGHLREDMKEMEPTIRNADMMSFDITAIKSNDAPGNANAEPFGLSGEEACQLCWYAGINEKLSSAGFYEYNPEKDDNRKKTASVIGTMIWYFIEGYYNREKNSNFKTNDYIKYTVIMPSHPATLIFYKSQYSEKWWMSIPSSNITNPYRKDCVIPCSYTDYETASKGELPKRYISMYAKLM